MECHSLESRLKGTNIDFKDTDKWYSFAAEQGL